MFQNGDRTAVASYRSEYFWTCILLFPPLILFFFFSLLLFSVSDLLTPVSSPTPRHSMSEGEDRPAEKGPEKGVTVAPTK